MSTVAASGLEFGSSNKGIGWKINRCSTLSVLLGTAKLIPDEVLLISWEAEIVPDLFFTPINVSPG